MEKLQLYISTKRVNLSVFLFVIVLLSACGGGTKDPGLPDKDTNRPIVSKTTPSNGAVDVADSSLVQVTFNKDMNKASVEAGFDIDNGVTGSVSYDETNRTVTFSATLIGDKLYTAILRNTIKDKLGNFLMGNQANGDYSWSFTTLDNIPPTILSRLPDNDIKRTISVNVNLPIVINFSEKIKLSTLDANFLITSGVSNTALTGQFSSTGNSVTFTPDVNTTTKTLLEYSTVYTVTVKTGLMDLKNNNLALQDIYSFKTEVDNRPKYTLKYPSVNNAIDVAKKPTLEIVFNQLMNSLLLNSDTFKVTDSKGTVLTGVYNYVVATNTATFTPDTNLNLLQTYQITLSPLFKDALGRELVLQNNGVSTFSVEGGAWGVSSNPEITNVTGNNILPTYHLASNGVGDAMLVWIDKKSTSVISDNTIYSKFYTRNIGWDAQYQVIVNGQLNHYLFNIKLVMDSNGRALVFYNDDPRIIGSSINYPLSHFYVKNKWISSAIQLESSSNNTIVHSAVMAANGKAAVILLYSAVNSTDKYKVRRFNTPPIPLVGNLVPTFQAAELIKRIGTFNGVPVSSNLGGLEASISNSGVISVVYEQGDLVNPSSLWSNKSPFQANTPIILEHLDRTLDFFFKYSTTSNTNSVVSFEYNDGTAWTTKYTPANGWEQEKQVLTIPTTAFVLKTIRFSNNDEMIVYKDSGTLNSVTFKNSTSSWEAPVLVSLSKFIPTPLVTKAHNEYANVIVSFNEVTNIVTVGWLSQKAQKTRSFVPGLGWQAEKTLNTLTDLTRSYGLEIVIHNDGTSLAVWNAVNPTTNEVEIFSAILQ